MTDRGTVDAETVTSQVQLILSRDLAREVIKDLNLTELPEFNAALKEFSPLSVLRTIGILKDPMSMTLEERVLAAYYDRLTAFAVDKSRVISIEFQSADPELAARVANADRRKISRAPAGGQAGSGPLGRPMAVRRARKAAQQGDGGRSQGRGLPRQVQSLRRQQQHQPGQPAAHRIEQPGFRRPRAEGRRRGARAHDPRCAALRPGAGIRPTSPIPS